MPEIPKSPPKWPLRPGVLVHVKCDTKQNLCANRAQSPFNASMNTSSLNNVSYASPLLAANSRNTSMASGKGTTGGNGGGGGGAAATNLSSTPITLPELPARNVKSNSNTKSSDALNNTKKTKSVARALLIDEDGITAKVESDDNSKEDESHVNINISDAERSETTTDLLRNATATTATTTTTSTAASTTTTASGIGGTTTTLTSSVAASNGETNNDELLRFTSSNLIERILGRLRWRREQSTTHNSNNAHNGDNNEEGILAKSNKRAVSLLRATGWFGSGKSTNSTTGLMSDTNKNHLNGITCSDSGKYFFHHHHSN